LSNIVVERLPDRPVARITIDRPEKRNTITWEMRQEIAEQITKAGTPVSGRAIRHIAKVAGAVARPGDGGRMVYALS